MTAPSHAHLVYGRAPPLSSTGASNQSSQRPVSSSATGQNTASQPRPTNPVPVPSANNSPQAAPPANTNPPSSSRSPPNTSSRPHQTTSHHSTSTPVSKSTESDSKSSRGIPTGAIAAIVVVGILLFVGILYRLWILRARQRKGNAVPLPPVRSDYLTPTRYVGPMLYPTPGYKLNDASRYSANSRTDSSFLSDDMKSSSRGDLSPINSNTPLSPLSPHAYLPVHHDTSSSLSVNTTPTEDRFPPLLTSNTVASPSSQLSLPPSPSSTPPPPMMLRRASNSSLHSAITNRSTNTYRNNAYRSIPSPATTIRGAPHLPHIRQTVEIVLPRPLATSTPEQEFGGDGDGNLARRDSRYSIRSADSWAGAQVSRSTSDQRVDEYAESPTSRHFHGPSSWRGSFVPPVPPIPSQHSTSPDEKR